MSTKWVRYYRCVGKDHRDFPKLIHEFVVKTMSPIVYTEFRKSGGQSGDLGEETAELDIFRREHVGTVQLYVVIDDTCNGYMIHMSALCMFEDRPKIDGEPDYAESVRNFFQSHEFVAHHSSFETRPRFHHAFCAYLDEPYERPSLKPFTNR